MKRTAGVAGILLLSALSLVTFEGSARADEQQRPVARAVDGRYQIVVNPSVRADTFLLDTQTGRVWRLTRYTNLKGNPEVWLYMDRVDSILEWKKWGERFEMVPESNPQP